LYSKNRGVPAASVQVIDDRTMHVLPAPTTPEGVHDVEISLPYGCSATLEAAVRIVAVALGFLGVVMVLGPEALAGASLAAALPVVAGALYALGNIATREWCAGESAA
jgi:hypothetical protein